jgi:hypothetical protein
MKSVDKKRVEDLVHYVTSECRIAPQPLKWKAMCEIFGVAGNHRLTPMILSGWSHTSDHDKRVRLLEQIAHVAQDETLFNQVDGFIRGLSPQDWLVGQEPPCKRVFAAEYDKDSVGAEEE